MRCRTVWLAELPHAEKLAAAAEELAPVRRAVEAVAEAVAAEAEPGRLPDPSEVTPGAEREASPDALVVQEPRHEPGDDEPTPEERVAAPDSTADYPNEAHPDHTALGETPEMESPPTVPVDLDAALEADGPSPDEHPAAESEPPQNIESAAARRLRLPADPKGWLRWPLTQLQTATLALIVLDAIIVGWRADFVRLMPQTASFYAMIGLPVNLRGLNFDGLTTATEQNENVTILVVEGAIVNNTHKWASVPHLRFAVRNAARQEIYAWNAGPPRATLPPGEAVTFRTRLASPPPDAHDVLVRFLNRYDVMNGNR